MPENEEMPPSAYLIERLRLIRTTRRITQKQAAAGITAAGYPIAMANLAAIERGEHKKLPYDFVVAAAEFYYRHTLSGQPYQRIHWLLDGPACLACHDDPPPNCICRTCRRYRNEDGEVVTC